MQLVLLAFAMAATGYVRTAMSPLQEAIRLALSLSDNQIALLQGPIVGVPVVLISIPLGILIDRSSRTRLLMVLITLTLVGSALTAAASGFSVLLVARALAGLSATSIVPVVLSLLADLYPAQLRGRATMTVIIGQVLGNSIAFMMGGALLARLPDWQSAMWWLTAPLVVVLIALAALKDPSRTSSGRVRVSLRDLWKGLSTQRAVTILLATGIVLNEIAYGAILIWSAPMLSRRFALSPDRIGFAMAIVMFVSGILGPVLGGFLADVGQRRGGPRLTFTMLTGFTLLSAIAAVFAIAPGANATCTLLVVDTTVILGIVVMGTALFTIVVPSELRGVCVSVLTAAILFFALAVAPVTVSILSDLLGGNTAIGEALCLVCAIAGVLAASAFVLARRSSPPIVDVNRK